LSLLPQPGQGYSTIFARGILEFQELLVFGIVSEGNIERLSGFLQFVFEDLLLVFNLRTVEFREEVC